MFLLEGLAHPELQRCQLRLLPLLEYCACVLSTLTVRLANNLVLSGVVMLRFKLRRDGGRNRASSIVRHYGAAVYSAREARGKHKKVPCCWRRCVTPVRHAVRRRETDSSPYIKCFEGRPPNSTHTSTRATNPQPPIKAHSPTTDVDTRQLTLASPGGAHYTVLPFARLHCLRHQRGRRARPTRRWTPWVAWVPWIP